jgi:hypothetical protein
MVVAALQELLGNGNVFSPAPVVGMMFGGRHDFSYAICEFSSLYQSASQFTFINCSYIILPIWFNNQHQPLI